jgi:hypothetical protein
MTSTYLQDAEVDISVDLNVLVLVFHRAQTSVSELKVRSSVTFEFSDTIPREL